MPSRMDARLAFPLNRAICTSALLALAACSSGGADDFIKRDAGVDLAASPAADLAMPTIDLLGVDLRGRDLAVADLNPQVDLAGRVPCRRGVGWTAFSFHYKNSTTVVVDTLGLPDRSNFQASTGVLATYEDAARGGGINLVGSDYVLIRFSLNGLTRISSATLTMFGRSYSSTTKGSFRAKSPLHGTIATPANAVDSAWPYDWTSVDYTANVRVGDAKADTAIQLYAGPSSNNLIINTVELCLDAS